MATGLIPKKLTARDAGNFLLVGRGAELALLEAEYERTQQGQPRVVLLCGRKGIGKSSLLRRFLDQTQPRLLLAAGDELEQHVAMGAVGRLLSSLGTTAAPSDVVEAGLAVAEQVRTAASAATVAVVLDDCELLDRPSLEALSVAMRHVEQGRVLWLLATSEHPREVLPAGVDRLLAAGRGVSRELDSLRVDDVVAWCQEQDGPGLALVAARQLRDVAAGRPGLISDLVDEFGWEALRRCSAVAPATRHARLRAAERLAHLAQPAAAFVKAAAVVGDTAQIPLVAAIASIGDVASAIDAAVAAALLHVDPQRCVVTFVDPMDRAAIYHGLSIADRSQLHAAAARSTAGDRALAHRIAAVVAGDEQVARDAETRARSLLEQGQPVAAARLLASAAQVTPNERLRDERLLRAAQLHVDHGDAAEAGAVAEIVVGDVPARDTVCAAIAVAQGAWDEAESLLHRVAPGDADGMVMRSRLHLLRRATHTAVAAAHEAVTAGGGAQAQSALAIALAVSGETTAAANVLASGDAAPHELAVARGVVDFAAGRFGDAIAGLAAVAKADRSRVDDRLVALRYRAVASFLIGDWDATAGAARQGLDLAALTSRHTEAVGLHAILRLLAAARGVSQAWEERNQPSDAASAELLAWADLEPRVGNGQRLQLPPAEDLVGPEGSVWPGWQALYVEGLVAGERLAEAQAVLPQLLDRAGERPWLVATLRRAQAAVAAAAGAADALDHYEEAIAAFDQMFAVVDAARARIAAGRLLRRNGRRDEAVQMLTAAVDACAGLGAAPAQEQAQHELALCGVGRRSAKRGGELTPQETSVAALAAEGLSSREIATRLTVSVKTVEYHLGNIYAKLDIRSRTQLAVRFRGTL